MRFPLIALFFYAVAMCAPAQSDPAIQVTTDGAGLERGALVARLRTADVVVLGETHDNPHHHVNQAWITAALGADALVAEMVQAAAEAEIAAHLKAGGDAAGIGPLIGWEKAGWPDWDLYRPIFEALRPGAAIFGAAMPRDQARRVMNEPASAILDDARFTQILDHPLAEDLQHELEREMVDNHCGHLPDEMAPMIVSAQRLRDASLAAAVLRARQSGARKIVVIAGNGHARRDRGFPAMLAEIAPKLRVVVLGQFEEGDPAPVVGAPYDFVWTTLRHERPDPCEELRKRKK